MNEPEPIPRPTTVSKSIKHQHPDLYGKLLEMDADLYDAGGALLFVYLVLLLGLYCGLWFGWYKEIPALADVDLGVFWVYALVFAVVIGVWLGHFSLMQRLCFQRHRNELLDLIRAAGLTKYQLISAIEGDDSLKNVSAAMKRDRHHYA